MCEGKQTELFQCVAHGHFDPNCCFSVYHGDHMDCLDLAASSAEEARTWITGLKYLLAGISDEDSLAKRQRTRDQYPSGEGGGVREGAGGGFGGSCVIMGFCWYEVGKSPGQ